MCHWRYILCHWRYMYYVSLKVYIMSLKIYILCVTEGIHYLFLKIYIICHWKYTLCVTKFFWFFLPFFCLLLSIQAQPNLHGADFHFIQIFLYILTVLVQHTVICTASQADILCFNRKFGIFKTVFLLAVD